MKINFQKTKQRLKADGRTVYGWARARGLNQATTSRILDGTYPPRGDVYLRTIEALRTDGLLVEDEDEQAA